MKIAKVEVKTPELTLGVVRQIADEVGVNWLEGPIEELGEVSVQQFAMMGWVLHGDALEAAGVSETEYISKLNGRALCDIMSEVLRAVVSFLTPFHPERAAVLLTILLGQSAQGIELFEDLSKSVDERFALLRKLGDGLESKSTYSVDVDFIATIVGDLNGQ